MTTYKFPIDAKLRGLVEEYKDHPLQRIRFVRDHGVYLLGPDEDGKFPMHVYAKRHDPDAPGFKWTAGDDFCEYFPVQDIKDILEVAEATELMISVTKGSLRIGYIY